MGLNNYSKNAKVVRGKFGNEILLMGRLAIVYSISK